ncbi:hypothetical protein ALP26_00340 [Pseudomonas savastanoi pv. glycinea]|uniref:Uncharacterized protein n=5 Tax=Pseudomonas savastanoi TaxID=29438 RepID=A0A0P9TTU0_PSESG|nr:hypothetical protein PsgB076_11065 [Pseudomonas savastanoi pv. glycinea str. B076]EFW84884.1 hypothetical protein PsgRace4_16399 [Pseudomonas savastanoi pv. glycinea str. race 4]KPB40219.1 Uncharacterized protein AC514_1921 [Pseudomonas savastanoi pv. phaseolicola]KPB66894.1 Uncharacterized protein AC508_3357 [Pseudomonas amygdali pv. mellea]KPC53789.1 Uncharacterized protein ABK00_1936 [Pseudomonas savastanoi pv. glycinea]
MNMKTWMIRQPSLHCGMLVGGVVIGDQMELEVLGRFFIDLLEKRQSLLMLLLTQALSDGAR